MQHLSVRLSEVCVIPFYLGRSRRTGLAPLNSLIPNIPYTVPVAEHDLKHVYGRVGAVTRSASRAAMISAARSNSPRHSP